VRSFAKLNQAVSAESLQITSQQPMNSGDPPETASLLNRAAEGDIDAWGALLALHQVRLLEVITFRLDPRLRGRIDAADVMQETFIAATARRAEFFQQSAQSLFLWLRWMVWNTLLELHRHHLGVQMRDLKREVHSGWLPNGSCCDDGTRAALIEQLTGGATGPATAAARAEVKTRLDEALGRMDPIDREAIALRHYEQLTSAEAAQVLGIEVDAASKRYLRALERLREILSDMPGGLTGIRL
jgi:RNA polymerase sigma-70 factor, ECF subfamily